MCYILDREVVVEKDLLYGELMDGFWFPPSFPPMNSWTQHMYYYYHFPN